MIIRCPNCRQKYSIRDEKMRGRSARIRCRACGESLLVSGDSAEPPKNAMEPSTPPANPPEVRTGDERISSDTSRMGRMSFENTAPMEDVSELRALAQRMTPSYGEAPEPEPAEMPPAPQVFSSKTTMPMFGNSSTRAAPPPPASSPAPSAKPETAPAPAAQIPLRGKSDPASGVPPAPDSNPSTGARNSTSILFSLAALADKERSAVVPIAPKSVGELAAVPAIDPQSDDHSGLIDLHRLMPSGSKLSVQLVKPVSSSEPPLAVTRDVPRPAPRTGRVLLLAMFGAILAVAAVIGMRSVLKWAAAKDASRLVAAETVAVAAPPPATVAEAEPKLDSLVPPPPPASEMTSSTEATVTKAVKSKSRRHRHSHRSKAAPAPVESPASNDPCHCSGDLACAMRCASAAGR